MDSSTLIQENGRDCIIKGVGDVRENVKITYDYPILSKEAVILVEEPYIYKDNSGNDVDANNSVFIFASLNGENNRSFTDGGGDPNDPKVTVTKTWYSVQILQRKDCQDPGHL